MNPLELLVLLANTVEAGAATPAQEVTYLAVVTLVGGSIVALGYSAAAGVRSLVKAARS